MLALVGSCARFVLYTLGATRAPAEPGPAAAVPSLYATNWCPAPPSTAPADCAGKSDSSLEIVLSFSGRDGLAAEPKSADPSVAVAVAVGGGKCATAAYSSRTLQASLRRRLWTRQGDADA